jgi:membrane protease YdiL (CAAX protease family)
VRLNSESFADFSHPFAVKDLLRGVGLYVGAMILYYGMWRTLWDLGMAGTERAKEPRNMDIFQAPFSAAYLLMMIVNPFLEESYVRGFLQTRLKQVGWSAAPIVLVSAGLQTSYHLYQGLLPCLLVLPFFLLFALYYQWTRRLWPVYLAHLGMDLLAMVGHVRR